MYILYDVYVNKKSQFFFINNIILSIITVITFYRFSFFPFHIPFALLKHENMGRFLSLDDRRVWDFGYLRVWCIGLTLFPFCPSVMTFICNFGENI